MKNRLSFSVSALALVLAAVGAYWYFSPYIALRSIAAAAKVKDADKFNDGVDYPRLRENLKGQFSAQMAKTVGDQSGNPFSALGAMLGMAMVNQMVDAFVRPEMVMQMMKDGQVKMDKPAAPAASRSSSGDDEPRWVIERKGLDRVIAIPQKGTVPVTAEDLVFVFERSGFATWKMTELRITFPSK
jgi:hypothetical protein